MGELKFKVGDKVMVRSDLSGAEEWRNATIVRREESAWPYLCQVEGVEHRLWCPAALVKERPSKRSNGTVTERLRRQVTEQAQEIERLKATLAESEAQKAAIAQAALGVEREARKSVELEASSCAKLRDLLKDAQRGEKRAKRTVELIRVVLNMVGEE